MTNPLQLPLSKTIDLGIRPMRFTVHDHHRKSFVLQDTLIALGAELVFSSADIMLIDHDGTEYYKAFIDALCGMDTKVVIYPHGADAWPCWDGVFEPHPRTAAVLTIGSGQKEAMEIYGYPNPIYDIGWFWCEQKPFQPAQDLNVLFAPVHVLRDGFIWQDNKERNGAVFSLLLARETKLKVRLSGNAAECGIWPAYGVQYTTAKPDTMLSEIDEADVVIANGTFAHLAIARGKPTFMFDGDGRVHSDRGIPVKSWDLYSDRVEYPLQFLSCDMEANVSDDSMIADWKSRFIGDQMKPEVLASIMREICDA